MFAYPGARACACVHPRVRVCARGYPSISDIYARVCALCMRVGLSACARVVSVRFCLGIKHIVFYILFSLGIAFIILFDLL